MLLTATFRPEFQPPWTGRPQLTLLSLNRLSRQHAGVIVQQLKGEATTLPSDVVDEIVEAVTPTETREVDATVISISRSVEALIETTRPDFAIRSHLPSVSVPTESMINAVVFVWRLAVFFPITLPFRVLHAVVDKVSTQRTEAAPNGVANGTPAPEIALETYPVCG